MVSQRPNRGCQLLALGLLLATGCLQTGKPLSYAAATRDGDARPKLTPSQVADVKIAMGQTLEQDGDTELAKAAYTEALQRDSARIDACLRLAVLNDRQAKFNESAELYGKAVNLDPRNADAYCDRGYSYRLQERWAEAETDLRMAIILKPDHQRAHNNLGLVLVRLGRHDEALKEFRLAGCSEADAHINLAYVLTLTRDWPKARLHYEKALTSDPSSQCAKKGLRQLNVLASKTDPSSKALPSGGQPGLPAVSLARPMASPETQR